MDDWLKSFLDEVTSVKCIKEVIEILKKGGFKLTKFYSNSPVVMESIPTELRAPSVDKDLDLEKPTVERTLGLKWNVQEDAFVFIVIDEKPVLTKRGILQRISLMFDPEGFIAPFIVRAKFILQHSWKANRGWDEDLDDEIKKTWIAWVEESYQLTDIRIPRCYTPYKMDDTCKIELHIFADASEQAFGAVAYIRVINEAGEVTCTLIMSKSRVAPLKILTIVRLELQAAVLAVRLMLFIMDMPIDRVCLWSDSIIVLQYINNNSRRCIQSPFKQR